MLYKIAYYIFKLFPSIKKFFWKKWYTIFANKVSNPDLRFMNYGYSSSDLHVKLNEEDEKGLLKIYISPSLWGQGNYCPLAGVFVCGMMDRFGCEK